MQYPAQLCQTKQKNIRTACLPTKNKQQGAGSRLIILLPLAELSSEFGQVELVRAYAAAAAALAGSPAISQRCQLDRSRLRLVHELRMGYLKGLS